MDNTIVPINRVREYDVSIGKAQEYYVTIGRGETTGTIVLHRSSHATNKRLDPRQIGIAIGIPQRNLNVLRNLEAQDIGVAFGMHKISIRKSGEAEPLFPIESDIVLSANHVHMSSDKTLKANSGIELHVYNASLKNTHRLASETGITLGTGDLPATREFMLSPNASEIQLGLSGIELQGGMRVIHYTDSVADSSLALSRALKGPSGAVAGYPYVGTTVGTSVCYALFTGGTYMSGSSRNSNNRVTAYSKTLVTSTPTELSAARNTITGVSSIQYNTDDRRFCTAYFAGGSGPSNVVDMYNYNVVHSNPTNLSVARYNAAGTGVLWNSSSVPWFVAGGQTANSTYSNVLDYFVNSTLSSSATLSVKRSQLMATYTYGNISQSIVPLVYFAGGRNSNGRQTTVDLYYGNGVAATLTGGGLYHAVNYGAAARVSNSDRTAEYALFAGGWDGSNVTDSITPYNSAGVRMTEMHLPWATCTQAGTTISFNNVELALFAGGEGVDDGDYFDNVAVFDSTLVSVGDSNLKLCSSRGYVGYAAFNQYAMVAGGGVTGNVEGSTDVDIFMLSTS